MPKTAVSYARFSSSLQHESSIEAQHEAINKWAAAHDTIIVREYADRGISGRTDQRPQFQQLISDLKKDPVDYVLVHKLDRFARDRYDAAIYSRIIKKRGSRLVAVAQDYGDGPEAVILEALLQGMAEYYSLNLATEVIKGRKIRIRQGLFSGGTVPFGYRLGPDQKIEPNPDEVPWVRRMFEEYVRLIPRYKLIEEMNAAGVRTRRGLPFDHGAVSRIMRNPVYIGTYVDKAGDETVRIENNHEAIIPMELWEEAQAVMDKRVTVGMKNRKRISLSILSGLINCTICGKHYRLANQRGRQRNPDGTYVHLYRRYVCNCQKNQSISAEYLEGLVCDYINKILSSDMRKELTAALSAYITDRCEATSAILEQQKSELRQLKKRADSIIHNMSSGVLSIDTLAALDSQLKEIRSQIDVLQEKIALESEPHEISPSAIDQYFANQSKLDPVGDPEAARAAILRFVDHIDLSPDSITIVTTFDAWMRKHYGSRSHQPSDADGPPEDSLSITLDPPNRHIESPLSLLYSFTTPREFSSFSLKDRFHMKK